MTKIEIPLSKKKNILLLGWAVMFVVLGAWFVFKPENFLSPIARNIAIIRLAGSLSIGFFGACCIYGIFKYFDKKAGLILDMEGVTDNTNASSIGPINWADISSIETQKVMATKFLLVFVKDADKYLDRTTGVKRKLLRANMKMYGTPLSINSNLLKCNFEQLETLLTSNLKEFQQSHAK